MTSRIYLSKALFANRRVRLLVKNSCLFSLFIFVLGSIPARAETRRVLPGHVPAATSVLRPLGEFPGTNSLRLAITLPLRHREALTSLLQRLYDPASPDYHRYLTPPQFAERFGPTAQDYETVTRFAKGNGLRILTARDSRMVLDVSGKVSDIERAFHVHILSYRHPTEDRSFYAPDVEPSLDADLPILDVMGLSDYVLPRPMVHLKTGSYKPVSANGSQPGGYYIGSDFRNAYAPGVTLTGAGQTVGLLELDGYYSNDIVSYENLAKIPIVPLKNIALGYSGPPGSGVVEVSLDIEMAIAMAPGLEAVAVFEGSSTNGLTSWVDILDSMAASNQIKQFSSSWGYTGFPDPNTSFDTEFIKMATQGQSFYQASGDGDAWYNPIWVPADSTYLTSVGGTMLTMSGAGVAYSSETVWNEGNQGAHNAWAPNGNGYLGSGGGVSTVYSIPSWQNGVSNSSNHASRSMRNIPDVALTADNIWINYGNGAEGVAAGTSCAAPLWAGFTALVNQQAAAGGSATAGFINPAIYTLGRGSSYSSVFHDITTGNDTNASSDNLYFAVAGYDLCTGWGTPNGVGFIDALSPEPLQITPSTGFVSSGVFGGPFSVTNQNFTLTNGAPASLRWSLSNTASWLSASPAGGTLTSGGAAEVVGISLNSAASNLAVGSYTNKVWFTNLNDTMAQSFQFILTVARNASIVSWTNPADITYGTALSSNELNATANTPGNFVYNPTNGAVPSAGTNTLSVQFTPTDTVDYSSAGDNVNLIVLPAPLTVTASNASRPYGQTNPSFGGTIAGLQNEDNITAAYSCSATSSSAVGAYAIVPSLVDPSDRETNYTVSLVNGTLTIAQAAPQLTWTNPVAITYGTALSSSQLNATANAPGNFVYSPTNGTVLNKGTNMLTVQFTPTDTADYTSASANVAIVVSPAPLTVTASNTNRLYGQTNPVFGGTIVGLQNQDNITATYSCAATSNSAVGTYAIVPSLVDPSDRETNYTVSLVNGILTIAQAAPQLSWTNPAGITYGAVLTTNQLNATANVPGNFVYTPTNGAALNAGTNLLSVQFTPTDTVDYSAANASVSLVVAPGSLTVTASNATRPYGQTNPVFGGTIVGLQNQDNITANYNSSATSGSPVGQYSIAPALVDPGDRRTNYIVSLVSGTLTVVQAAPQLIWTNPASMTYGAALSTNQLNAEAGAPGVFVYTPTNGAVPNTGTNLLSVQFTPSDTVDYSSASTNVSLVVLPAPLTVTASNVSRPYGQTNPAFGGTMVGLQNQDNISATYSSVATSNSTAGPYAIVPALVDPGDRETNYNVSLVNGTLTVAQAMPVISWTNPTAITYGSALSSNQLDATANVPGNFVYSPTNGAQLNTGTNLLSVQFTPTDTVDYSSAIANVSLVVSPAALTATASNASRSYGQTNPVFGGTIVGVQNQDNIKAAFSCSAVSNTVVGAYAIVPALVDLGDRETNYTVSLVNGTLNIVQAAPQISWTNPTAIGYGTALSTNQLNATASAPGNFVYMPTNGSVLTTGTNLLSVQFTPNDTVDYSSAATSVSLVVAPAELTVTASNVSRPYGQTNPVFGGTIVGLQNQDNITAAFSCTATSNSAVGAYAIAPSLVDPGDRETNYTVSLVNGTLTIAQVVPQLTWTNPATITYGAALSSNQLDATANVPGSFVYNPTNGAVLSSGTNLLSVQFTPTDAVDYTSAGAGASLVVSPAVLTVTASNVTRAYGVTNPVFGGTVAGVQSEDNITATFSCNATSNSVVGAYAIVPALVDPHDRETNYTVSLVNGTLTIAQAVPQLTWTNPAAITYGAALGSNQLNASASAPGNFVYNPTNGAVLNSGTNLLSVQFTPSDAVDYKNVGANVNIVISPAVLTVTASNATRAYGQTNPFFSGTLVGLQNQDNITANFSCSATSNSVVGAYAIVPALFDPGDRETNYTVSLVNGTLTIAQAVPQLTWTNPAAITYGAALSSNQLNASASAPGNFAYNPTNGEVLNAGTNLLSVQFAPTDTVDYASASASVSLVVSPALLTVTASNATRAYGQTNPFFSGTLVGLQNQDNITANFSCSATSNSVVGAYAIVPALVDLGDRETNYTVSLVNGTLTIAQAVPQLTWTNPAAITYGAALGSNQLNASASAPGNFAYEPTNGEVLNAGTNLLSVQFAPTDTVDYASASASVSLIVSPALLTVTSSNATRAYGQTNPGFGGTLVGLQNQDNITANFSCNATSNSAVGAYAIVPALVDPSDRETNYTVSLVNGTLTIAQAVPQLTWSNPAAITYGAALGSNQLNASANTPGSFVYSPSNGAVLNAGSNLLSVQFTPSDAMDYKNGGASVSLVVSPALLTVTASNASRVYGQTNPAFGGTIVGLENQDNITAVFGCGATSNSAAGAYAIVPALVDPGDRQTNYAVSLVNGTLTVFAPPVILGVQHSGGSFTFSWSSTSGQLYQIQTSTNLAQPDWTNLNGSLTATNSTTTSFDLTGTNAEQFYRVLLLP